VNEPAERLARLRLRISAAAESRLRTGHPWIYAQSIQRQNRPGQTGELAVVFDRHDRFLAVGLFDSGSALAVRVLHRGKPREIDSGWWAERLEAALEIRQGLFPAHTNGWRCLNGESDCWPGLVLDRYDQTLVLKLYTAAWLPRLDPIAELFVQRLAAERLVLRLSRNIQKVAIEQFGRSDGQILFGPALEGPVTFLESGLRFEADVLCGQKTGFFLDQRENRRHVQGLAAGRTVLNAFSFTGAFSLYAARGGARAVTDLDLSAHALAGAERNFLLNQDQPNVGDCQHESVQADAFDWLAKNSHCKFDLVILDPPSFAKKESERAGACRAYGRLVAQAMAHLAAGGFLVACSCSAHVPPEEFFEIVRRSAAQSGRRFEELRTTGHAPDHPATFPEAHYLKAIFLQF